jgi:diacylglycerol kinase family enzyme
VFAVVNPASGTYEEGRILGLLEEALGPRHPAGGLHVYLVNDAADKKLADVVKDAVVRLQPDVVVAVGGDGTVSGVANGLVEGTIPLGIVPTGTANLLARELGIPVEPELACQLVASQGSGRQIDLMRYGGRISLCHISFGVFSNIGKRTSKEAKRWFRRGAYVWNAIPELASAPRYLFNLEIDGRRHRVRGSFVMIANVGSVGAGSMVWGSDIRPDDGAVDVFVVRAQRLREFAQLVWLVMRGEPDRVPQIRRFRAESSVVVRARRPLPVRADGEDEPQAGGRVEILRHRLSVIAPAEAAEDGVVEAAQ